MPLGAAPCRADCPKPAAEFGAEGAGGETGPLPAPLNRRVDTTGGDLPAGKPCDAQHAGDQERIGYSATYLFYATGKEP